MSDPRSVVPESVMPPYAFLSRRKLDYANIADLLKTHRAVGVPYSDEMIASAKADVEAQANPDADGVKELAQRYPKAQIRAFDGNTSDVTEMDAMVAYLQMLGILVDFAKFDAAGPNLR
jgi:cytochrome c oxidase cbb3-type subunit II